MCRILGGIRSDTYPSDYRLCTNRLYPPDLHVRLLRHCWIENEHGYSVDRKERRISKPSLKINCTIFQNLSDLHLIIRDL